jgi:hypothetical protein
VTMPAPQRPAPSQAPPASTSGWGEMNTAPGSLEIKLDDDEFGKF